MNKGTVIVTALILLAWSGLVLAGGRAIPIVIEGQIGDFAPEARVYEVAGKAYRFQEDIPVYAEDGTMLAFSDPKGGMRVRLIGESLSSGVQAALIRFTRIVVMGARLPVKESQQQEKAPSTVQQGPRGSSPKNQRATGILRTE